jgi:transposase
MSLLLGQVSGSWCVALTVTVDVPSRDREILESWLRAPSLRAGLAQRARIVLLAADGVAVKDIVERVGVSKPTVIEWKKRYAAEGLGGLEDRPKPGRRPVIDEVAVVLATLEPPPERLGVTHWSSRLLANELDISHVWVSKIWKKWGLAPWRSETFKFSTDPELEAKVRDVVGLYLNPPDKAVVLCVDEKSQVQALDRTAPILPIMPGVPEKATHDYIRHGTTTLFAALEVATGRVEQACLPPPPSPGVSAVRQAGRQGLSTGQAAPGGGQLRHPQAPRGASLAGTQPADHPALHPDQRVLAEHGRDLLLDHHPPGHPPRQLRQCQGAGRRDRAVHRRLERTQPPVPLDQDRRRATRPLPSRSKNIVYATLA